MIAMKKVLYATDFSRCAQAALPIAYALARDYKAELVLLHVRPTPTPAYGEFGAIPPEPRETDEAVQARLRQLLSPSSMDAVACLVRDGDAATEILSAAKEVKCDMIVLGTHGRSGLERMLVGSVAEAVLRQAPCPVLTVKPPTPVASKSAEAGDAEPEADSDDLKTVCAVGNPTEAEVIRTALRYEGIGSVIEGAQQGGFAGTLGFPIKVQVRVGDFDRANKLIQRQEARRR